MRCQKCGEEVILDGTKFCPNCGAKLEAPVKTPNIKKSFTSVKEICLGLGNRVTISPSSTPETTITIDAPEEIKNKLKIEFSNGILSVTQPQNQSHGLNIINGRGVSISGVSCSNVVISNGSISVNGQRIVSTDGVVGETVIDISTPVGVDVDVDTFGGLTLTVGDLKNKVSLDTSGGCNFSAECITDFDADTSGGLVATIKNFSGGRCNLDTSGSCSLNISSGSIEKLTVDASGSTHLNVDAQVDKAVLDISGSISGALRADIVRKDICGSDRLKIVK